MWVEQKDIWYNFPKKPKMLLSFGLSVPVLRIIKIKFFLSIRIDILLCFNFFIIDTTVSAGTIRLTIAAMSVMHQEEEEERIRKYV